MIGVCIIGSGHTGWRQQRQQAMAAADGSGQLLANASFLPQLTMNRPLLGDVKRFSGALAPVIVVDNTVVVSPDFDYTFFLLSITALCRGTTQERTQSFTYSGVKINDNVMLSAICN